LAEFDGAATEIFVVVLPLSQLPMVIAALAELPDLELTSFQDQVLETSVPFDASWRSRLELAPGCTCQHSLRSAKGTARHLQVYLWIDAKSSMIEVELVFWNDLTFPQSLGAEECEQRFETLMSLAEACRAGVSGARCLLTAEHSGPTEELLKKDEKAVVVW
jgi:hypothetical protein